MCRGKDIVAPRAGTLFAVGLGISHSPLPGTIRGFLAVSSRRDPTLAALIAAGICPGHHRSIVEPVRAGV